jgi:hypothetical protein
MAQQECTQDAPDVQIADEAFTEAERERLTRLRRAVERGERSDHYPVNKRQDFVRWLVNQGKLSEN